LRTTVARRGRLGSLGHFRGRIRFNIAEELLDRSGHSGFHNAHVIVDRHIHSFQYRNNLFTAHVELLGIFINP
jgi:hypothetical protein